MKSIKCIIFLMVLSMVICITACGNSYTGNSTNAESSSTESQSLPSEILPLNKITHYKGNTIADKVYASVSYDEIVIEDSSNDYYKKLADTLSEKAAKDKEECDNSYAELGKDFTPYDDSYMSLYSNTESYVIRCDEKVVSILDYNDSYFGGVHGSHSYKTYNYDTTTGKEISFSDVVVDKSALLKLLDEKFLDKYTTNYFYTPSQYQNENTDYQIEFLIGYEGITFYYDEYLLNSYAAGPFLTYISFNDLEGIIDTKYVSTSNSWMTPFGKLINPVCEDFDGDGTLCELSDDPYFSDYGQCTFSLNGKEVTFEGYYSYDNYVVNVEGNYYLYIFAHGDNDCVDLKVIDLKSFKQNFDKSLIGEHIVYNDNEDSSGYKSTYKYILINPNKLVLETRFNIFSTFYGHRTYQVKNNGELLAKDKYYLIDTDKVLKTITEITFKKIDDEGNVLSEEKLPAGTLLGFVKTDGESFVDFALVQESEISTENYGAVYRHLNDISSKEGKEIYRLEFTGEVGERTFQGLTEDEAFEICYYAG